jgi:hypothetical protein
MGRMLRPSRQVVLAVMLLGACRRGGIPGPTSDAAVMVPTGAAADAAIAEASAPDAAERDQAPAVGPPDGAAVLVEASVDTPPAAADAGADSAGATAVERYEQFRRDLHDRYYDRWAACFGTPRGLLTVSSFEVRALDRVAASLRLGLIAVDEAAVSTCLAAVAGASCEQLAEIFARGGAQIPAAAVPGCARVLAGQVAPGHACLQTEECQSADQFWCQESATCGSTCVPRSNPLPAGSVCSSASDRCVPGSTCRLDQSEERLRPALNETCFVPHQSGQPCAESDDCAAGLHCALSGPMAILEGTCRPIVAGTPCAGNWECLWLYVCAGAGPGKPGSCQLGKRVGQPCTVYLQGVNEIDYSDCAPALECLDLDGAGPRCVGGAALGQSCGEMRRGKKEFWLQCDEGFCDTANGPSQPGVCRPLRQAGGPCAHDGQCADPNYCQGQGTSMVCGPEPAPPPSGTPCRPFFDEGSCGQGAYCAPPPDWDPQSPSIPQKGVCAPVKRIGEACNPSFEPCEPLAECVGGVCIKC